jgi:hypothetical protein
MPSIFVDPWDLSEEAAEERYQKLSRRLNDRMREMEKRGITTEAVEKYEALVNDMTGGRARLPKNAGDPRQALNRVQDILNMKGSSWKATKEFALKGMKTFEEKYGIKFKSPKQYIDFWRNENVQKLKQDYGNSGAALMVAEMQTAEDDQLRKLADDFLSDDLPEEEILTSLGFRDQTELLKTLAERRRRNERNGNNRRSGNR